MPGKESNIHYPERKPLVERVESAALLLPGDAGNAGSGEVCRLSHTGVPGAAGLQGCLCITAQVMDVPIKTQPEHLSLQLAEGIHTSVIPCISLFVLNAPHAQFRVFRLQGRCIGLISTVALIITYILEWSLCKHKAQTLFCYTKLPCIFLWLQSTVPHAGLIFELQLPSCASKDKHMVRN